MDWIHKRKIHPLQDKTMKTIENNEKDIFHIYTYSNAVFKRLYY